ncbi:MAG: ProQ/FinO family protein [Zoogloeaceae bacterium]|nr:ProQ/FinO family protein [Zoogloeaceae bacterium]
MNTPTQQAASPVPSGRLLLKQLQEQFAVFRDCLPLAIGIDKQLLAAQPDIDRKVLRIALRMHTHSLRYLKVMDKATQRFDLEGKAVAEVTEEHRTHATEMLRERFRKEGEQRRAKQAAEKAAEEAAKAEKLRADKLNQLAAKFAKH